MRKRNKTRKAKTSYTIPLPSTIEALMLLGQIGDILSTYPNNKSFFWIQCDTSNGRRDDVLYVEDPELEKELDALI